MNLKINTDLLPIKAHYFLLFSSLAPVLPFLPVLAKQLGIDAVGVGVIFAVLPVGGMLAKPLAGWLADCLAQQKVVFILSLILTGVCYSALQLVSSIEGDFSAQFECSQPKSILKVCGSEARRQEVLGSPCPLHCSLTCKLQEQQEMDQLCVSLPLLPSCSYSTPYQPTTVQFSLTSSLSSHDTQTVPGCLYLPGDSYSYNTGNRTESSSIVCEEFTSLSCQIQCDNPHLQQFARRDSIFEWPMFWLFFLLNLFAYSAFSVAVSVSDATCFDKLQDQQHKYGAQRVWGSIGWGTFTVVAGYLVDSGSHGSTKDYLPAFLLLAVLLVLDIGAVTTIRTPPVEKASHVWGSVARLLCRPRELLFLLWCFTCGALCSVIWHFLPWYLEELATPTSCSSSGASWVTTLLGINMAVQCFLGEVPMLFLSGWILRRLGHANTMTLVLAAFSLRLYLYSLLTDPWYSLPIELLNGVTFGVFYAAMTSYADTIAPPGMGATMQGIMGAVYEGAGVALGSLLGGALYNLGPRPGVLLFQVAGGMAGGLCVLHALAQVLLQRLDPPADKALAEGPDLEATEQHLLSRNSQDLLPASTEG